MKLIVFTIFLHFVVYSTQTNLEPEIHRFHGNNSFFKLLDVSSDTVLFSGLNRTHSLNLNDLTENSILKIEWEPVDLDRKKCINRSRAAYQCDNYINFFAPVGNNRAIVCGTRAYSPLCRYYNMDNTKVFTDLLPDEVFLPKDPLYHSTAVFAAGRLYTATMDSNLGPLIFRNGIRTEPANEKKQLANDATFVASFEHEEFVYFFFRETPPGECRYNQTHSRVARVCKNDQSHSSRHHEFARWSSFLKARLECSDTGDSPVIYDEIQSVSGVVDGLVYAVFTTSTNGSAVCAFRMEDIENSFDGAFAEPENGEDSSCWVPVPETRVPKPRPGNCRDYKQTTEEKFDFIKNHPMMEKPVTPYLGTPVVTSNYKFTQVTIDGLIRDGDNQIHHTLFIGTDDGRVIYVAENGTALVTEETQILDGKTITQLKVVSNEPNKKLIVVSMDEIVSVPISTRDCRTELLTVNNSLEEDSVSISLYRTSVNISDFGRELLCSEKPEWAHMVAEWETSDGQLFQYWWVVYVIGGSAVVLFVIYLVVRTARRPKVSKRYDVEKAARAEQTSNSDCTEDSTDFKNVSVIAVTNPADEVYDDVKL